MQQLSALSEPDEVQCALAWYTGAFADRERQLGVEILLDALLGTNNSPLKAALLAEKLGADIDMGFDDSTLQPTLELVLRGATEESARKFAPAVRKAVDDVLARGVPAGAAAGLAEFGRVCFAGAPGSLPDGVAGRHQRFHGLAAHRGSRPCLLHTDKLFASPAQQGLADGWFDELLRSLELQRSLQVPTLPKKQEETQAPARTDAKLVLDHPLTVADLGEGAPSAAGQTEQVAGATVLRHPSAGSLYLNFYYDLGHVAPEDLPYLDLLTDVLDELKHADPHGPAAEHPAQHLAGRQPRTAGLLDRPAGGRTLPCQTDHEPEPAGTQPAKGRGAGRRVAV